MQSQILQFLRQADGYFSGEDLSRHLKISRAGIWKHIEDLRGQGYEIEAVPHRGYRMVSSPDKLIPTEIQHRLKTKIFGKQIFSFDTVSSTMDEAFRLAMNGATEGTIICAETQTKGRGRMARSWISPKSTGIYFSIILRPVLSLNEAPKLTLLSAVAVCEAVRDIAHIDAKIKWPNDILIGQKKVAGILTELNAELDRLRFVIVGIGVNVNSSTGQLPVTATSLRAAKGKPLSRIDLLQMILARMEYWYFRCKKEGFSAMLAQWKIFSATLGERVRIVDEGSQIAGKAIDLDSDGALLIFNEKNGQVVKRWSGTVETI